MAVDCYTLTASDIKSVFDGWNARKQTTCFNPKCLDATKNHHLTLMRLCDVFNEMYKYIETQDKNFNNITEFFNTLSKSPKKFPIISVNQNKIIFETFQKIKQLLTPLTELQKNPNANIQNNLKRPHSNNGNEDLLAKKSRISVNPVWKPIPAKVKRSFENDAILANNKIELKEQFNSDSDSPTPNIQKCVLSVDNSSNASPSNCLLSNRKKGADEEMLVTPTISDRSSIASALSNVPRKISSPSEVPPTKPLTSSDIPPKILAPPEILTPADVPAKSSTPLAVPLQDSTPEVNIPNQIIPPTAIYKFQSDLEGEPVKPNASLTTSDSSNNINKNTSNTSSAGNNTLRTKSSIRRKIPNPNEVIQISDEEEEDSSDTSKSASFFSLSTATNFPPSPKITANAGRLTSISTSTPSNTNHAAPLETFKTSIQNGTTPTIKKDPPNNKSLIDFPTFSITNQNNESTPNRRAKKCSTPKTDAKKSISGEVIELSDDEEEVEPKNRVINKTQNHIYTNQPIQATPHNNSSYNSIKTLENLIEKSLPNNHTSVNNSSQLLPSNILPSPMFSSYPGNFPINSNYNPMGLSQLTPQQQIIHNSYQQIYNLQQQQYSATNFNLPPSQNSTAANSNLPQFPSTNINSIYK